MQNPHGSGNKVWVIELDKSDTYMIPVERGRFKIGVRHVFFSTHAVTAFNFGAIVAHAPYLDETQMFLPKGQTFAQLAVYNTENKKKNIYIDYSHSMKFHVTDFTHSANLIMDVRDIYGYKIADVSGVVIIEIHNIS